MAVINYIERENKYRKHFQIYEAIASGIRSGQYNSGQKIPTMEVLAKQFDVSRPTVGRALSKLEKEGLVTRRQGSGVFIDQAVKQHTLHKNGIGFLIPSFINYKRHGRMSIFSDIIAQVVLETQLHNFALAINSYDSQTSTYGEGLRKACSELLSQNTSGLIFFCADNADSEKIGDEIANILHSLNIPIVLWDRDIFQFPKRSDFDLVGLNNERAGYIITSHLIDLGCRNIRFLANPLSTTSPAVKLRFTGYRNAVLEHGLNTYPVVEMPLNIGTESSSALETFIKNDKVEAFVCVNDETAILLMKSLAAASLKVPQDIRIVGFDDLAVSSMLPVPLTTIRQPIDRMAAEAVFILTEQPKRQKNSAREILFNGELIIRDSCGAHI